MKVGKHDDGKANEILQKIVEVTGLADRTVSEYLHGEFKQANPWEGSHAIPTPLLEKAEKVLGEEGLKKLKKQILKEDKLSPQEKAQLTKQRKEEKRRKEEERLQKEAERRAKSLKAKELLQDKDFQKEVLREISKPQVVKPSESCPSGVCEVSPVIEEREPINIMTESLVEFWNMNPQCQCKKCKHYGTCGVIR